MGEDVEVLEDVVKDEPHFITKVIDEYLCLLTMLTKHFMSEYRENIMIEVMVARVEYEKVEIDQGEEKSKLKELTYECSRDDLGRIPMEL
ncbi:hypothetical protein Tco_0833133 [Tanacetum coccineum]